MRVTSTSAARCGALGSGPPGEAARSSASCSVRSRTSTVGSAEHGLLDQLDGAPGVVRQREHFVELDARRHAVALDDPGEPGAAVERLRVLAGLPLVDAAGPAALAPDEVLADQAGDLPEAGRDLVEVLPARGVVDVGRQLVAHGRGDHTASSVIHPGTDVASQRSNVIRSDGPWQGAANRV